MTDRDSILGAGRYVTDGGLETDLLFNRGFELPEFAAFPLLETDDGAVALESYYDEFAEIALSADAGLILETPTWRANPDWAFQVGYDREAMDRANRAAVQLMQRVKARNGVGSTLIAGVVGPRGDGYVSDGRSDHDEAAEYHSQQIQSFADEGVDFVHAMTITGAAEAVGVVKACRAAGAPVAISFTVETDGRLPDGSTLREAIELVDMEAAPDWYGVNCAHPTHIVEAFDGGEWQSRITALRPNASTLTHEELDAMEVLDTGDVGLLTSSLDALRPHLPQLAIVGGCCGTDSSHVAALWGI
ncbi:homocysteine S-methyltransferase family protein [Aeromicrobium sp.]|uniref:homocysteine S-methyltransferase family protein n=1 Tax=Aeromicrobium sp. TaxID=1871063 RepID=UPI002FCA6677